MKKVIRDVAASIRQRLKNAAMQRQRQAAEVLQYFVIEQGGERSATRRPVPLPARGTPHRDRFVLKGAMVLVAWHAPAARPTIRATSSSRRRAA